MKIKKLLMKEHPILFSTPMVKAILDERKKMTRRTKGLDKINLNPEDYKLRSKKLNSCFVDNKGRSIVYFDKSDGSYTNALCPYGQIGDILWVRESFELAGWNFEQGLMTIEYKDGNMLICDAYDPSDDLIWLLDQVEALENGGYIEPSPTEKDAFIFTEKRQPFKPSIHMPKLAARIWLKITNVKVERLQDITEADAVKEGITPLLMSAQQLNENGQLYFDYSKPKQFFNDGLPPFWSFNTLWCSINGGDSWEANPWVWAIEFEVLSTTGKPTEI